MKAAKSSLEKGADYAKNEIQRLERMLEKVYLMYSFNNKFLLSSVFIFQTSLNKLILQITYTLFGEHQVDSFRIGLDMFGTFLVFGL